LLLSPVWTKVGASLPVSDLISLFENDHYRLQLFLGHTLTPSAAQILDTLGSPFMFAELLAKTNAAEMDPSWGSGDNTMEVGPQTDVADAHTGVDDCIPCPASPHFLYD